jgi:hypothetical protein
MSAICNHIFIKFWPSSSRASKIFDSMAAAPVSATGGRLRFLQRLEQQRATVVTKRSAQV